MAEAMPQGGEGSPEQMKQALMQKIQEMLQSATPENIQQILQQIQEMLAQAVEQGIMSQEEAEGILKKIMEMIQQGG